MSTGWLRGTVKAVESGDQITIVGGSGAEKRLTLSSLVAPKLGKRDGVTKDEPFAWASREFLRHHLVGKAVVFKIDYVVEAIGNREFGSVFLGQADNIALSVVAAGWAKVRAGGSQQSPYLEELKKAEEAAQLAGAGLWSKDPGAISKAVREISSDDSFNAAAFVQGVGKGKHISAIVEHVMNGSMLRVTLLPTYQSATIQVCGCQAPSMGRRPAAAAPAAGEDAPAAPAPVTAAAIAGGGGEELPEEGLRSRLPRNQKHSQRPGLCRGMSRLSLRVSISSTISLPLSFSLPLRFLLLQTVLLLLLLLPIRRTLQSCWSKRDWPR